MYFFPLAEMAGNVYRAFFTPELAGRLHTAELVRIIAANYAKWRLMLATPAGALLLLSTHVVMEPRG